MPLSWNEIKSRALAFSREWRDAANEDSEAKPFLIAFFEVFGITNKRVATFEHAVKKHGGGVDGPHARNPGSLPPEGAPAASGRSSGGRGFVDLFWPGILLVEMKSRGKSLTRAYDQALDRAVDAAYAYKGGPQDASRVAFLFARYRQLLARQGVDDTPAM